MKWLSLIKQTELKEFYFQLFCCLYLFFSDSKLLITQEGFKISVVIQKFCVKKQGLNYSLLKTYGIRETIGMYR